MEYINITIRFNIYVQRVVWLKKGRVALVTHIPLIHIKRLVHRFIRIRKSLSKYTILIVII